MKDKDFVEVSTFVRELEGQLLSKNIFEKGAESLNLAVALEFFSTQSQYSFKTEQSLNQADLLLISNLEDCYSQIYSVLPYSDIIDILAVRYEFESLKNALFNHLAFSETLPLYPSIGSVPSFEYESFFQHQDPFESSLPDYLLKPTQNALEKIKNGKSSLDIIDSFAHAMFAQMLNLTQTVGNSFIIDMVKSMIDFHNTLALLKLKTSQHNPDTLENLLVEGGKTSTSFFQTGITRSLSAAIPAVYHKSFAIDVENAVEYFIKNDDFNIFIQLLGHIQLSQAKKADLLDFGPEVPFSYIIKKENEITRIRTILYAKSKKLEQDKLKPLLFLK